MLKSSRPAVIVAALVSLLLWLEPAGIARVSEANGLKTKSFRCPSGGVGQTQPPRSAPNATHEIKCLPHSVLQDQRFLWSRPFRPRRSDLPWEAVFFGTTGGLIAFDRRVGQSLSANPPGAGYDFGKEVSRVGAPYTGAVISASLYLAGWKHKDDFLKTTALLSLRAAADSAIIALALKTATQRPRPTFPGGVTRDHNADGQFFAGGNSFPSGHTIEAFSVATVFAERYRDGPWVPVMAYSLAGLVGAARIAEREHFPSDVFAGAVLGYLIGRHVSHGTSEATRFKRSHLRIVPFISPQDGSAISIIWKI